MAWPFVIFEHSEKSFEAKNLIDRVRFFLAAARRNDFGGDRRNDSLFQTEGNSQELFGMPEQPSLYHKSFPL